MNRVEKLRIVTPLLGLLSLLMLVTGCGTKAVRGNATSEQYAQPSEAVKAYGNMRSHATIMKDGLVDDENMQLGESSLYPRRHGMGGDVSEGEQGMAADPMESGVIIGAGASSSHSEGLAPDGYFSNDSSGVVTNNRDVSDASHSRNGVNQGDPLTGSTTPENQPLQKGVTFSGNLQDVHFEFDSWGLSETARETLEANAEWLRANPHEHVTIEGHCDERGTQSYNYVLGEKRAAMVQQYLSFLGVPLEQMYVASYGKDRPACRTMTTDCFEQNRRAHFNSNVSMVSQQAYPVSR